MLAALVLLAALVAGLRWPGVLIAGCLFTYQASSLSQVGFLGEAYIGAAAVIVIVRSVSARSTPRLHAVDIWLVALVAWAMLSTAWAPRPGLEDLSRLGLSVAGMYAVARFVVPDNPDQTAAEFLIGCVAIGGVMAVLLSAADQDTMTQIGRLALEETTAVGLAQPLPFVAVAAALLFLLAGRFWHSALAAVSLAAIFYTSLLSGTRSVFLASVIALFVAVPLIVHRNPLRGGGLAVLAVVTAVIVAPLFFSEQLEPAIERLTMNFTDGSVDLSDASSAERFAAYEHAIGMFFERPILGYGHGSFSHLTAYSYPHNLLLEAAAEIGLVGIVLTIGWLVALGLALLRLRRHHHFAGLIFLTMGMVALVQMQVSFTLFMARPLFMLTALAAALAPISQRRQVHRRAHA